MLISKIILVYANLGIPLITNRFMLFTDKTQSGQAMDNESLDEYLNSIEADVQIKIDAMKSNLEKFGDQFMQNIKNIRKELHKLI
jgi:hypothetical protein